MSKKSVTHVFMIVDKSGSMFNLQDDVIGGFNTYINKLGKDTKQAFSITAVLFDTTVTPYCTAKTPDTVPAMDHRSYWPGGGTALLDAVGFTIGSIAHVDKPDRVLVVIQTDGHENASREETYTSIAHKIADRERQGWEFIYIGQGVDQWDQARSMGVSTYLHVNSSGVGTRSVYSGLATASGLYAAGQSAVHAAEAIKDEIKNAGADN